MYITTLLALLALTTATLRITGHPDLVEYFANKYPGGLVPYSLANYGDVPYGKTLSGEIGLPSVLEDCVFEELPETSASKTILLVERNDCTFTQKSINVQKEGGKLAIIMDNISEDPDHIIMVDDGRGSQVHIPTLLINFEDGQEILNSLHSGPVVVSISFETVVREKAELTLWLDITDHKNFIFLRNLRPYFNKIKEHGNSPPIQWTSPSLIRPSTAPAASKQTASSVMPTAAMTSGTMESRTKDNSSSWSNLGSTSSSRPRLTSGGTMCSATMNFAMI